MKILLTGANGFIGHNLVSMLQKNHEVRVIGRKFSTDRTRKWKTDTVCYQGDLLDVNFIKQIYNEYKPEAILHFAANPNVKLNEENPSQIIHDNIISTQNLCHYAINKPKFIFASSVVVYGDLEDCDENSATKPTSIYGTTKLACEGIVNSYTIQEKVDGVSMRLCATVGHGLTHGIVKDFIYKIINNPVLECFGESPGADKPFCHVVDIYKMIEILLLNSDVRCVNVVPEDTLTVEEVGEAVMTALGKFIPIKFLGEESTWKGDNKIIICYNELAKNIGWHPYFLHSREAVIRGVLDNVVRNNQ